jgi:hypothetical protein
MVSSRVISDYESLALLTREMHEAAVREDWDGLVAIEQRRSDLVERMKSADAVPLPDEASRRRKDEIISAVLEADKEIRRRVEDWLGQLRQDMQSNRQAQRLLKAYGA